MAQNSFPTNIANTSSLVDWTANLKVLFNKGFESFAAVNGVMRQFYVSRYEGPAMGITFRVEERLTGLSLAKETSQGDDFATGTIAPGYYKDVTVVRRTISLPWTWFFMYHNKYPDQLTSLMTDTGYGVAYRLELDLTHPFTFGTSTTYVNIDGRTVDISTGDGLSLYNTAHTLTNSATTYRNRIAANPQGSAGSLEAAENITNQQIFDNNGNRRPARKEVILVASDQTQYNVFAKILRSTSPVDAPNSGVYNPFQGKYRLVRAMWLDSDNQGNVDSTKSKYWLMVDMMNLGAYLEVTENPTLSAPTEFNGGTNWYNENSTAKASACYEPVVLDPRFVVFSSGDGVA